MNIYSIGDISVNMDAAIPYKSVKLTPDEKEKLKYVFMFMFFGILWICAFLKAKSSFIVMVAATSYYFDSNENKEGEADVAMGFKFTYLYHIGSIAMGSFIIALVQLIRYIFLTLAE